MPPNARQRQPEIWTAAYGATFASHVSAELNDGHSFARSVAEARRAVSSCFDIADAAVEAYEAELDRLSRAPR